MTRTLTRTITAVFHPLAVPAYTVLALLFADAAYSMYPARVKIYVLWMTVLYSMLIPAACALLLRRLRRSGVLRLDRRRAVALPLLVGAICYMLCAISLQKIPSLMLLRKIAVAAMMCEVFCAVATPLWRVSTHLAALGAVTALLVILNIVGALTMFRILLATIIVTGAVASSLLYLGRNDGRQILAGFAGGFIICTAAILLF